GLLTRSRGNLIRVDDFPECKRRCQFHDPDGQERVFAFSPDGKRLATGGKDHVIRIRDTASGKEVHSSVTPQGTLFLTPWPDLRAAPLLSYPGCCNLLSDGRTLAVSVDGAVAQFDATTGRELRRDKLPPGTGLHALATDGKQAVVSYKDIR